MRVASASIVVAAKAAPRPVRCDLGKEMKTKLEERPTELNYYGAPRGTVSTVPATSTTAKCPEQ